jgi:carboxyl-terminal processing protease
MKRIVAPALLVILGGALLVQLPIAIAQRTSQYDLFDPIIDVHHLLESRFVDSARLKDEEMRLAMIDAMITTLDDPHTVYVPPQEEADFDKVLRGTYVGIGCEVEIVNHYLTIVSPMDGSPALEAGVLAGDIVLEIEGQSTLDLDVTQCINRLMGEPGTPVSIKVRHLDGTEEDLSIVRRQIVTRTVKGLRRDGEKWNHCIDDKQGLAYIHVTQFNDSTSDELKLALDGLQQRGLNGLVLDLRDDPGGGLPTAVEMADLFLEQGTIVTIKPRTEEPRSFTATAAGTLPDFPMIVLVNGGSASASEIVAGALKENGRAKVLGTRTFGKGSVQEVRELDYNRGVLKYTTAYYLLPSGRNINRSPDSEVWGVDPDPGMVVPMSDEDLRDMYEARRDFEIIRQGNGPISECVDASWVRTTLKDEQLARAIDALSTRVQTGEWPEVGGEENAAVVALDQELSRAMDLRGDLLQRIATLEDRIAELHELDARAGKAPLLPPDIDLLGGTLTVADKHGNVVGTYRIEDGDLELALGSVKLSPVQ